MKKPIILEKRMFRTKKHNSIHLLKMMANPDKWNIIIDCQSNMYLRPHGICIIHRQTIEQIQIQNNSSWTLIKIFQYWFNRWTARNPTKLLWWRNFTQKVTNLIQFINSTEALQRKHSVHSWTFANQTNIHSNISLGIWQLRVLHFEAS